MYDTINFNLKAENYPGIDFLEHIPQYLTTINTEGMSNNGPFINGYLGTYKISINNNRVKLSDSSLCRFIQSNTQNRMTLNSTKQAIQMMSDMLNLQMDNADITRIDIASNILTQFKPENYYPNLGSLPGHKRFESEYGVYYSNSMRVLVFYDKVLEQKKKRIPIEPVFQNKNLLRFEYRCTNHLAKQFKMPEVKAKSLYNETFYINRLKEWKNLYLKINKKTENAVTLSPTTSTIQFIMQLAGIAMHEVGEESVLQNIKLWQEANKLTKKQAADLRVKIREIASQKMKIQGSPLMAELDRKIKEAVRFYL